MKIFFFTFLLLFLLSVDVSACWCRIDPEEANTPKKFRKAILKESRYSSIVFSGKATERTVEYLKFEVEQIWKGKKQNEIFFTSRNYTNSTDGFLDSCAFNFELGKSYLVYAYLERGKFEVSKCGRTQIHSDAAKDIEELNLLKKKTRLFSKIPIMPDDFPIEKKKFSSKRF
jgi:hypothetical protein